MKRTLAVDGDIVFYRIAAAAEIKETGWGDEEDPENIIYLPNTERVTDMAVNVIQGYNKALKADNCVVAFSAPGGYRYDIFPDYKGNRKKQRRPTGLKPAIEWAKTSGEFPWKTKEVPQLEADDVIGIMMTKPGNEHVVGVSDDKDFMSIPGKFYRVGLGDRGPQKFNSSVLKADLFFATQCLTGDPTDGFKGAKGIGAVKAEKILKDALVGFDKKGDQDLMSFLWPTIVDTYKQQNHENPEEDALLNARMARILRWDDYNHETKEPILWTPK